MKKHEKNKLSENQDSESLFMLYGLEWLGLIVSVASYCVGIRIYNVLSQIAMKEISLEDGVNSILIKAAITWIGIEIGKSLFDREKLKRRETLKSPLPIEEDEF